MFLNLAFFSFSSLFCLLLKFDFFLFSYFFSSFLFSDFSFVITLFQMRRMQERMGYKELQETDLVSLLFFCRADLGERLSAMHNGRGAFSRSSLVASRARILPYWCAIELPSLHNRRLTYCDYASRRCLSRARDFIPRFVFPPWSPSLFFNFFISFPFPFSFWSSQKIGRSSRISQFDRKSQGPAIRFSFRVIAKSRGMDISIISGIANNYQNFKWN